jgi:hypothetical protein
MDLNRQWTEPSKWGHPTIHAAKNMITELDEDKVRLIESLPESSFIS